jgi:hypothetical protein
MTIDLHFMVVPFISGTAEPVLSSIIFKSEQDISQIAINWKLGIDLKVEGTDADDMMKVAKGRGPICFYCGKKIPCFYGTSPKARIMSQLLTDMLKFFDTLGVYDQMVAHPFLLLDGHHSQMMLPFLQYVNEPSQNGTFVLEYLMPLAYGKWQMQAL